MSRDVMPRIEQPLIPGRHRSLLAYPEDRLQIAGDVRVSGKPDSVFLPAGPAKAPAHAVLAAVRERGTDARLADL